MAYKYKTSHRASLYVPGEEIPEHILKKEGLSNERNKEMTAEEAFRQMNSDGYEEAYKKYSPSGCRIGNTEGKNTSESLMEKIYPEITIPPMPPVKPPRKDKIKRIYEDDDFIIDIFPDDQTVRVSIFNDNHYIDEVFVRKDEYLLEGGVV